MGHRPQRDRIAGLRFTQLIRQLTDDGWTLTAIAEAIGCDVSLVSKWKLQSVAASHDVTRKGIRDDIIQGIYDGLGVQANYLFMTVPKGYPNRVRLKSGETRSCEKNELDHKDFRVITNVELEIARDKKERAEMRNDMGDMRAGLEATNAKVDRIADQLSQLLAAMGATDKQRSTR